MLNIFTTTAKNKIKSLAIGSFDGLHLGHQKLVDLLDDFGALLIVDKFQGRKLCTNKEKGCLANKQIIEIDFESIKNLDGKEFLDFLKKEFTSLEYIVVGYDFCFGKNKAYKAKDIENLSGIKTVIVDEFCINGFSVHTSLIKEFLVKGDIEKANLLLGRNYSIKGEHIQGQGLGSRELFATLNLKCDDYVLPKEGVYVTLTQIKNRIYKSISFLGIRSSDGNFAIESHILEKFDQDINCGEIIEIQFISFLRENQKFQDLIQLKKQIAKDIQLAQDRLKDLK
ncbi:bifunctional riboflavin kinase/FAD synthetase [Campylobacter estrildidarum]|uniref:Riboflavin biosynthesis protein n=1 Tax=Campylobacter estrildidarum TaxID=2510189 RepID=A0A4U7BU06_9BACT|nr:bifunctional riboflavin kinase/FAD synthetase [Campylobacter estrildidarum]TKX31817.1 bifunctional riboflavin kinase/FAD synthetase [Campylobacter estrildidarum]